MQPHKKINNKNQTLSTTFQKTTPPRETWLEIVSISNFEMKGRKIKSKKKGKIPYLGREGATLLLCSSSYPK